MSASSEPNLIPATIGFLREAEATARKIGFPLEGLEHAYQRQILMILSQAYAQVFRTSAGTPDWVPHTGALFPWGAPNPDTIYAFAPLDSAGLYRISGRKGTETLAALMLRRGGANTGQVHGAPLGEIDLIGIEADDAGHYSFLLSAERPAGYEGLWHKLHAEATGIMTRRVTISADQQDGACAIERLDAPCVPDNQDAASLADKAEKMIQYASRFNEFMLGYVQKLRDRGIVNVFEAERFANNGGLAKQLYYQGLFDIAEDEALILESPVPDEVLYWSVQLMDPFYSAIEFVRHQSSLNGAQAHIDPDRHARFVVSARDPGIANWLDSGGWLQGGMMWRWHADTFPEPTVRRVKFSELRRHLPADTHYINAAQRAAQLAERVSYFQSRRRW